MSRPDRKPAAPLSDLGSVQSSRHLMLEDEIHGVIGAGRSRIMIGAAAFCLVMAMMVARLAEISLLREPAQPYVATEHDVPYRADIVDRNGNLLATTLETYSLYVEPQKVWDPEETTHFLSLALPDLDQERVLQRLSSDRSFEWIARNLTPAERQAVFDLGMPGLGFRVEPKRVYLHENMMSHVLGFADQDLKGVAGIEKAFDARLSQAGSSPLSVSLDMRVQYVLEDEMRAGFETFHPKTVMGMVMDVNSGEVLALANYPDFDPNQPGTFSLNERRNRALADRYELGSTSKPFTAAMALEAGLIDMREKLPVHKSLIIGPHEINEDHKMHEPLALPDIIAESSNRGVTLLAQRAGPDLMRGYWQRYGLLDRVSTELHEVGRPLPPQRWREINMATVSYGHGISFSPLTLATGWMPLINGGYKVNPTFVKTDGVERDPQTQILSARTSEKMRKILRYTVVEGTGGKADVAGCGVAGKTGSADKPSPDGGYDTTKLVTSFASFFPYDSPKYLVLIVYDEPKKRDGTTERRTAGWNATRTAGAVIERIAPILNVSCDLNEPGGQMLAANFGEAP